MVYTYLQVLTGTNSKKLWQLRIFSVRHVFLFFTWKMKDSWMSQWSVLGWQVERFSYEMIISQWEFWSLRIQINSDKIILSKTYFLKRCKVFSECLRLIALEYALDISKAHVEGVPWFPTGKPTFPLLKLTFSIYANLKDNLCVFL